jgi:molecular chaperone DnaK (HSP70)
MREARWAHHDLLIWCNPLSVMGSCIAALNRFTLATVQFYMLIPRHTAAPCTAVQTFTTLHDNQEQACILVLYGDDPVASNNLLLGQVSRAL